ncbi:MAG: hypothetical protein QXZ47_03865, partial [Candidatus Bathyarchaeia archaeon]
GSPYFPLILDRAGNPNIYNVGPIETPLIANSSVLVSISQEGWSPLHIVNGRLVQTVIADKPGARLYVEALNLTLIKITYFDAGKGNLSIDLFNPYSRVWIRNYIFIQKRDTNEWKTYEFLAPVCEKGFVEFNLYASENFTVCSIEATRFDTRGKSSFYALKKEFSDSTFPPSLMVYLPILRSGQNVTIRTDSYGKRMRVEIFEGVIQPLEKEWWLDLKKSHRLVANSSKRQNPSLCWKATKSGLYTVVITLYGEPDPLDVQIDLQVAIEG